MSLNVPDSQQNCGLCREGIEATTDRAILEQEATVLWANLRALAHMGQVNAEAERVAHEQGLNARRIMASKVCANCIFHGVCPDYRYAQGIGGKGDMIVPRYHGSTM